MGGGLEEGAGGVPLQRYVVITADMSAGRFPAFRDAVLGDQPHWVVYRSRVRSGSGPPPPPAPGEPVTGERRRYHIIIAGASRGLLRRRMVRSRLGVNRSAVRAFVDGVPAGVQRGLRAALIGGGGDLAPICYGDGRAWHEAALAHLLPTQPPLAPAPPGPSASGAAAAAAHAPPPTPLTPPTPTGSSPTASSAEPPSRRGQPVPPPSRPPERVGTALARARERRAAAAAAAAPPAPLPVSVPTQSEISGAAPLRRPAQMDWVPPRGDLVRARLARRLGLPAPLPAPVFRGRPAAAMEIIPRAPAPAPSVMSAADSLPDPLGSLAAAAAAASSPGPAGAAHPPLPVESPAAAIVPTAAAVAAAGTGPSVPASPPTSNRALAAPPARAGRAGPVPKRRLLRNVVGDCGPRKVCARPCAWPNAGGMCRPNSQAVRHSPARRVRSEAKRAISRRVCVPTL
jgi:hypothetical protein